MLPNITAEFDNANEFVEHLEDLTAPEQTFTEVELINETLSSAFLSEYHQQLVSNCLSLKTLTFSRRLSSLELDRFVC